MPLQEWIHKLEEGEGAKYIKLTFLLLAFAAVAALYNVRNFKNFNNPEAMDSAQVGRQLANGKGFSTKFIRPLSVKLLQSKQGETAKTLSGDHPDLANAPVYPVIQAGLIKALPMQFEISDGANFWRYKPEVWFAMFNQALFLLLLWVLFKLGCRMFDRAVAGTTVAVVGFTELFWKFTVSGLPTVLLTLITVTIIWRLFVMESATREQTATDKSILFNSIVVGLLVVVGALTRYSYGWILLPIVGFAAAFFGTRRGQAITAMAVIFILGLAPWCYRNYAISGNAFGLASYAAFEGTPFFQHNRLPRSMPRNLEFELNKVTMSQFMRKALTGVGETVRNELPRLGGSWATALFLVGLLTPFRNPGLSRMRYFIIVSLILFTVVQSVIRTHISEVSPQINSEVLIIFLAPLVFMFGIALFYTLLDQIPFEFPHYRVAAVSGFVAAVSLPLILSFLPPKTFPMAYPPYYPPYIQEVAGWMREDELIMSDMPWAVAWYGDRTCIWTTLDAGNTPPPNDFYAINDYLRPIKALYLTPITMDARFLTEVLKGTESAWSRFAVDSLVRTNVPAGFPLRHAPRGFLPDFLILTDRKRWQ